jgi:hypothetical protein
MSSLITRKRSGRKKYEVRDEAVFERIDVPWKAYFLGWLYADGNIAQNLRSITMWVTEADREIVDYFGDLIYTGRPALVHRKASTSVIKETQRICFGKPQVGLAIYRVGMCRDLVGHGLVPNKSLTINFPAPEILSPHLVHHFIRGYFDGNGTVFLMAGERKRGRVAIVGPRPLIYPLKDILAASGVGSSEIAQQGKIYKLIISDQNDVCRFANYVYHDADFFLRRKRDKFEAMSSTTRGRIEALTPAPVIPIFTPYLEVAA